MAALGIGGFFFRADDPKALQAWYETHLGISFDYAAPWTQEAGPTLFQPFRRDTDQIPDGKSWMMNFRVADIDALLAKLRGAGIEITTDPEWDTPETGRFARIHDPEGNRIELWQPPEE